jgi:F-type H+-transporting ATPase subunit epsilon
MMNIKILLPSRILLDKKVTKIQAEATYGHFTLLPKHIDFVAPLVTGILVLTQEEKVSYVAIDGGLLVKKEQQVWISTPRGMLDDDLDVLQQNIEQQWESIKHAEKKAKTAMSKLESDAIRRYVEWRRD